MENRRKAVVILGPHRSGTSALARTINLLGADVGSSTLPAAKDNITGFWEHSDIVQLNEWILRVSGYSWDVACDGREPKSNTKGVSDALFSIETILKNDFANSQTWLIKDPRICCLLSLWKPILERLNVKPYYVLLYRSPMAVASSLKKRNGFVLKKGLYLWLSYLFSAEKQTRGKDRLFIEYDDLLSNESENISYLDKFLQLRVGDKEKERMYGDVGKFLQKRLKHNRGKQFLSFFHDKNTRKLNQISQRLYNLLEELRRAGPIYSSKEWGNSILKNIDDISHALREQNIGNGGREQQRDPAQRELERVSILLTAQNSKVTLVIPTHTGQGKEVSQILDIRSKLSLTGQNTIILKNMGNINVDSESELNRVAGETGIDVVEYHPPFDTGIFNRLTGETKYLVLKGFPVGYLSILVNGAVVETVMTQAGAVILLRYGL